MNSEAQQFCLRWHNYSTSLLASLPRLLDWDDLTDVTLYAGGLSVKAHRIVLSACSQYFKAIFKLNEPPQLQYTSVDGGDLISQLNKGLSLGPTFWKLTIKTSPVPFYFKYRIVVSIKSSVLNESCSGVHMFALKKLFAVGIMTDPPTPLRYQGPRRVECGAKCVSLTPYCIHGWLVKPDTCGLKWICNHAACGVTEGTQPLLLRNLPCGQNFTVKLEGDPLVRAAHAHERRIYEWNRVVTIVLQVDRGFWPQRRSVIPEEPIIKQSPNWISSVCRLPGLELPVGLRANVLVDEASSGNCSNPVRFRPEFLYLDSSLTVVSEKLVDEIVD